ncbi:hypothetical protein QFZ31_006649 [Neobacillus niacini]|uniref:hypothetical protein n=1 Tax=Neobacillus driksii TaxID=3035913 RepID=UPI002782D469|nr:hypothetical protein [Neobacillus niacini]MDQ0976597.1 hypothetical protein [Neobacillus niacini]
MINPKVKEQALELVELDKIALQLIKGELKIYEVTHSCEPVEYYPMDGWKAFSLGSKKIEIEMFLKDGTRITIEREVRR